jgi:predicted house-cleaning NTP pyrophosphatase (Maf/HAM1 superfamily)
MKELSPFVYLASQSPRRRELLAQIGVRHEPLLAGPDEDAEALEAEIPGELPAAYVERVTRAKLAAARRRLAVRTLPDAPILCADTTVALGRRILAKPADAADAARILGLLSGRTHRVITAVDREARVRLHERLARELRRAPSGADRCLCRRRRALRQSRRLCDQSAAAA